MCKGGIYDIAVVTLDCIGFPNILASQCILMGLRLSDSLVKIFSESNLRSDQQAIVTHLMLRESMKGKEDRAL